MLRSRLLPLLFLGVSASLGHAESYGRYIGTVQTEWIEADRKMRLLAPFTYVDPKGVEWQAPSGAVIDGASIPVFAWSVIGGPYNGRYRDASVIHDVACEQKVHPWESVHEAFYWAMLASGVEQWRAKVMYAAVYHFGPRWPRVTTVSVPKDQTASAPKQALAQAEPGSSATVVAVRTEPPSSSRSAGSAAPRQDVDVRIAPPPRQLSEQDFETLKAKIIEAEAPPAPPKAAPRAPGTGGAGGAGGSGEGYSAAKRGGDGGNPMDLLSPKISLSDIRGFKRAP